MNLAKHQLYSLFIIFLEDKAVIFFLFTTKRIWGVFWNCLFLNKKNTFQLWKIKITLKTESEQQQKQTNYNKNPFTYNACSKLDTEFWGFSEFSSIFMFLYCFFLLFSTSRTTTDRGKLHKCDNYHVLSLAPGHGLWS